MWDSFALSFGGVFVWLGIFVCLFPPILLGLWVLILILCWGKGAGGRDP